MGQTKAKSRIVNRVIRSNTPIEDHRVSYGLWVKREDKACIYPGPPFSKARGVYAHLIKRPETTICVLDTYHSQGGWAVSCICQLLNKTCRVYYPEYKNDPGPRYSQIKARELGAVLVGLPAGRSSVLYHRVRKDASSLSGYAIPNALKLIESVEETAKEVPNKAFAQVLISASSGTIAAGVIRGFYQRKILTGKYLIHLGYSRSHEQVLKYLQLMSSVANASIEIIDEKYGYKDKARAGETPSWSCNEYYDLKAFRWWLSNRTVYTGETLFWNIG